MCSPADTIRNCLVICTLLVITFKVEVKGATCSRDEQRLSSIPDAFGMVALVRRVALVPEDPRGSLSDLGGARS